MNTFVDCVRAHVFGVWNTFDSVLGCATKSEYSELNAKRSEAYSFRDSEAGKVWVRGYGVCNGKDKKRLCNRYH